MTKTDYFYLKKKYVWRITLFVILLFICGYLLCIHRETGVFQHFCLIKNLAETQKVKIIVPKSKTIRFYIKNFRKGLSPKNFNLEIIDLKYGTKFVFRNTYKADITSILSFRPLCSSTRDVPYIQRMTPVLNLNREYEMILIFKDKAELTGLSLWMATVSRNKDFKKDFNPIISDTEKYRK